MSIVSSVSFCLEPSVALLRSEIVGLIESGAQSVLVLACEDNRMLVEEWNQWLHELTLPVFGGLFPQLIHGNQLLTRGVLLVGLGVPVSVHSVPLHPSTPSEWHDRLQECRLGEDENQTVMVMLDGLGSNIESLLEALYSVVGSKVKTVGGGAGSLSFTQAPCLFTAQGVQVDKALIVTLPVACGLGVGHGWEVFAGPFLVTHSQGNRVCALNYKPAFEVYQTEIEKHSDTRFADQTFLEIAKTHPFGISNVDGELLVRDPIALDGDALICVGEVPPNSMVYLLKGDQSQLIVASAEAARVALHSLPAPRSRPLVLLFDCISRSLYLDGDYPQELAAVCDQCDPDAVVVGALSLGEICSTASGPIGLLNKSTVVTVF